ncbi:hypothetical protein ACQPYA_03590 [Micromonospora sp. CA-263727]
MTVPPSARTLGYAWGDSHLGRPRDLGDRSLGYVGAWPALHGLPTERRV